MGWVLSRSSAKADADPEVLFQPTVSSHENRDTVPGQLLPVQSLRVTEHPAPGAMAGTGVCSDE